MTYLARPKMVAVIVLDGWGIDGLLPEGDAIGLAQTKTMTVLRERYPYAQLQASGEHVGLPAGVMGNSEVGHLNLGAGRVVYQDLTRIDRAIGDRSFIANTALRKIMGDVRDRGGSLHLMGLLSDAGVHSHDSHVFALLDMAAAVGVGRVAVHAFTDGRDSDPQSGAGYVRRLLEAAAARANANTRIELASVSGRFYAMDRDKRWERVAVAYDALVNASGPLCGDPVATLRTRYAEGETDEFIRPFLVGGNGGARPPAMADGDGVICWNYRADRVREMCRVLLCDDVDGFERPGKRPAVELVGMTRYDDDLPNPVAFGPQRHEQILGAVVAAQGGTQLRVAETEKYAHVTYFFSGGDEAVYPGEERILVPSVREVATYDLAPAMRARELTDETVKRLKKGAVPDLLVLNYANADMVGHTGNIKAAREAVEVVDRSLGRLLEAVLQLGGVALVTADHGNAEQMIDPQTGKMHTAHTTNPVPLVLVDPRAQTGDAKLVAGKLADVAPTALSLLGMDQPAEMTGQSLLVG